MSKKRSRPRILVSHSHPESAAEPEPANATATNTTRSVTLRPAKRGRYTQNVSHTEQEEEVVDNTPEDLGEYAEYNGDDSLLDADFSASSLKDTSNSESVMEEVDVDAANIKKTVRTHRC